MSRHKFDVMLRNLQDDLLVLGSMVGAAIVESIECLNQKNMSRARWLVAADEQINDKRYTIEAKAISIIATQQPVARDLRTLAAILKIIYELERMGDYAKGNAKITLLLGHERAVKPLPELSLMAGKTHRMLHQSLRAFVENDADLARSILAEDDKVDALYDKAFHKLLTAMSISPKNADQATYLLWVAHNLERSADRVMNICHRVIFSATGHPQQRTADDWSSIGFDRHPDAYPHAVSERYVPN